MKNYVILNNNNSINEYVCFMNNVEDVEYSLDEITKDMKDLGCTRIIIDLFLTNGYSFNRFFEFNSTTNDFSIVNPRNIDNDIYNNINIYLKNNIQLLENSALSLAMKEIIAKQLKALNAWIL